jgi:ABC-type lipoprotein export system ATPase subunit
MNDDQKILVKAMNVEQVFKVGEETIPVLQKTSFVIRENTFNIIYGPSGSGKSTLLNLLSGLQEPSSGTVYFNGENVYAYTAEQLAHFRANRLGMVYQQNYWVSSLNVIENVAIPISFMGYSRAKAAKLAMDALQRVDMAPYAKKSPLVLSGGEQQRIAMARALVNDPEFIIADEPTGNLDTHNGDMIIALLQSCKRDLKRTIILVTHNMEYLSLADQLLHIQDGTIKQMQNDDISKTTETLITEMRARINRLAKVKNG